LGKLRREISCLWFAGDCGLGGNVGTMVVNPPSYYEARLLSELRL
jgi:hypothetical protein